MRYRTLELKGKKMELLFKKALKSYRRLTEAKTFEQKEEAALELAQECLEQYNEARKRGDEKIAQKWLALVHRFMRLAHLAGKESVVEYIQKRLHELQNELKGESTIENGGEIWK